MIVFPQKYSYKKNTSVFSGGSRQFSNVYIAGLRSVVIDKSAKEIFFTKGSEYQVRATIPKYLFGRRSVDKRVLCFPGFNHGNWYHIVADMGFQVFLAKQRGMIDAIALPSIIKSYNSSFLQFFQLFDLPLLFVNHPRESLNVSQVACFDKYTGRLSEAIKGGVLKNELKSYFDFLNQSFVNSNHYDRAKTYSQKIFSTRKGNDSRVYNGVLDIESEYEKKGYQIVHFGGMNVFEQMAVMQNATHLSGFHGANLTNLLFAHQCKFVEELITRELSGDFQTIAKFKKANHSRRKLL